EEARATFAVGAVRMFGESPIVGTGPGTWVVQRLAYTEVDEPDVYIPHAHNIEVQTLAEQGLVGAAAGLVVVAFLVRLVRDGMRDPDPLRRRMGWGAFAGLAYFGFHQLLDFYANMPAALFAAAIPVAYLDATSRPTMRTVDTDADRRPVTTLRRARPLARAGAVVVALAAGALALQEVPALQAGQAVELADRGDWESADDLARRAAAAEPDIGSYAMTAGLTAARAGDHAAALVWFERVARRDDLPEAWLNLAAEQAELGDVPTALESLRATARLGRQRPAVAMATAELALRLGVRDLAVEMIASAIERSPTIAADPWWDADAGRAAALAEAVEIVMTTTDPSL
ncbi:MAG: O-antigen ligase family protein, partial [Chloroflexi bacterium]|nr:O-antigen ligase family protein [Chloroflexota bacterium]